MTKLIFTVLDLTYSIIIAVAACWIVASILPYAWPHFARMMVGMLIGMAIGNVLALFFSILLGMFEAMYIGCFSGMFAGMLSAMYGSPEHSVNILMLSGLAGAMVWLAHFIANEAYKKARKA